MKLHQTFKKAMIIGTPVLAGMFLLYAPVRAANDNNGAQDEKQMIQTGLAVANAIGVNMHITHQDPDMVGLGSYLVNVTSACNSCHTPVFLGTTYQEPTGNPYFLPPFFTGQQKIDPNFYLSGGFDFGVAPQIAPFPPSTAHIYSRNLTPDKNGLPEGHTLSDFIAIMKTGADTEHFHPNCGTPGASPDNCMSPPNNGNLLQVMPWPFFQNMTDRQLTAIYVYLSTIPCLEGDPGNPNPPTGSRCH
jgi:hypothetical protein